MGLYKRPESDVWWMDYRSAGKRIRKPTGTADIKEAEMILKEAQVKSFQAVRAHFAKGGAKQHVSMTLGVAVDHARVDHFQGMKCEEAIGYTLDKLVRLLGPSLDVTEVDEDTFAHLRKLLRAEGRTDNTVNHYYAALNVVLRNAKKVHKVSCSSGIKEVVLPTSPGRTRTITRDEESAIREWFSKAKKLRGTWTNADLLEIIDVMLHTGMRAGEMFKFTAGMVDGSMIVFPASMHKTGGAIGDKAVALDDTARTIIERRIARYELSPDMRIFPYSSRAFTRLWYTMRSDMGMRKDAEFVPYAMRHTFATRLLTAGASMYHVSRLMGHSSVQTTEKYAHTRIEDLVEVVRMQEASRGKI